MCHFSLAKHWRYIHAPQAEWICGASNSVTPQTHAPCVVKLAEQLRRLTAKGFSVPPSAAEVDAVFSTVVDQEQVMLNAKAGSESL